LTSIRAYPKIISEAPEKSGVEAFARIFPVPFRNFGICSKTLIDEKPRLLGNSSDALTDQIHVTYRLANGGKVERQYKLIMPDASLELLRLDSTEAVKQRISETFATLLDAELSPFLVTDSLFQNELEPSHADAKRLLSAFLEDSSERTIESKYFPDKLCRAIISFPRISPDGGVETLKTEPRTIVEASIKDNPSNLNLASKSTSVMRLYITDDCVRTLEVLRSIGMLDSDPSVENIESMDINVYSVKGFYFRSYGDEIEPEGLLDMSPSDFKSLLNVSRSSYYAAKGGYIVKVGMRGNDFWTTLFIPEDVAPGYLKFQSS
jgi:hypothetical protein